MREKHERGPDPATAKAARGRRPATMMDVARASGVSVATVSRVLNGKAASVAPATAERVSAALRSLHYSPSEIGRSLKTSATRIVVLLVPDSTNDFCADVATSLEHALQTIGRSMVLCNTAEEPDRQDQLLRDAESLRPSAIVLLGAIDTPTLRSLVHRHSRVIFVNRRPPPGIRAPYVGIDNYSAGRMVAEHFLAHDYVDCAVIHGPRQYSASRERLTGFLDRFLEAGASKHVRPIQSGLTIDAGYQHGREIVATKLPRAIFCGNDMIAYGVNRAVHEAGLQVPGDVALFGFDDNRVNRWLAPWLTTVHVPALDFGEAVRSILDREGQRDQNPEVILPFTITYRTSA